MAADGQILVGALRKPFGQVMWVEPRGLVPRLEGRERQLRGNVLAVRHQQIAEEACETLLVKGTGRARKPRFQGPPKFRIELVLRVRLHVHEYEVADQVGLAQRHAGGVEALEDTVGVLALQRGTHEVQALADQLEHPARCVRLLVGRGIKHPLEERHRLGHAPRQPRLVRHQGHEGILVMLLRQQAVVGLPLHPRVHEVIVVDLLRQLGVVVTSRDIANRHQQQRQRRQSLLAIDQVEPDLLSRLRRAADHIHQEAHEVVAGLSRLPDLLEAVPQPLPLRKLPAIVALEHGDHVLAGRVQHLAEGVDDGLHARALFKCLSNSITMPPNQASSARQAMPSIQQAWL